MSSKFQKNIWKPSGHEPQLTLIAYINLFISINTMPEKSITLVFLSCIFHSISIFLLNKEMKKNSRNKLVIMILASFFLVVSGVSQFVMLVAEALWFEIWSCRMCLQTIILLSSLPVAHVLSYRRSQQNFKICHCRNFLLSVCPIIVTFMVCFN